jgi:delta 1-pyrroline-5-carboxylate dehydrogenase
VDNRIRDKFITRLKKAVDSIVVGDSLDYATFVNPVIDDLAVRRLVSDQHQLAKEIQQSAGRIVCYSPDASENVEPMVVEIPTKVALQGNSMFEKELFGPILHIVGYDDEETALSLFNQTNYGLTGGIFSQSQNEIDRLTSRFECGNIYVNRTITGARVDIEPFGGFKMSGTGPKAGGKTYLSSFHINKRLHGITLNINSTIREISGQRGYISRLNNKRICFVYRSTMNLFAESCRNELIRNNIEFDVVNIAETLEYSNSHYDVYVVGSEVEHDIMQCVYNNIRTDTSFPVVVSQVDHYMKDTLSDLFMSTRTHSVNIMRHGAELS